MDSPSERIVATTTEGQKLRFQDIVSLKPGFWKTKDGCPIARYQWPTVCVCMSCGGVRSLCGGGHFVPAKSDIPGAQVQVYKTWTVDDKEVAFQVALMQHGFWMHEMENAVVHVNQDPQKPVISTHQGFFENWKWPPRKCECACDHDFQEYANPSMFDHRYECTKCHEKRHVDSSG